MAVLDMSGFIYHQYHFELKMDASGPYGTDLMQRRNCSRVRVQKSASTSANA